MIEALAGTGKTTTLEMIETVVPTKPILYLAFNRKVADDAAKRMSSTTSVRSFNGMGHRVWANFIGKSLKVDPKKLNAIFKSHVDALGKGLRQKYWDDYRLIMDACAQARTIGYIPKDHALASKRIATKADLSAIIDGDLDPTSWSMVDAILAKSISTAYDGWIDFTDQIYMPTLFGGKWPEFPLVMVDEFQDLNALNHLMIRLLAKHRLIGVGDENQSIYEFRGAVQNGMSQAKFHFDMTQCDLTMSFRCPSEIVKAAHWRVPKFQWAREGGSVQELTSLSMASLDSPTVICRNNAPLFALAMKMLQAGQSVAIAGSDIGPKLVGTMKGLCHHDQSRATVLAHIDAWQESREARGQRSAKDTADCMRVFAAQGDTLSLAIAYAEHLFKQSGRVRFTTGHKAKGLEWSDVIHLDPWMLDHCEQDKNLGYVILTRSSDTYRTIHSTDISA